MSGKKREYEDSPHIVEAVTMSVYCGDREFPKEAKADQGRKENSSPKWLADFMRIHIDPYGRSV